MGRGTARALALALVMTSVAGALGRTCVADATDGMTWCRTTSPRDGVDVAYAVVDASSTFDVWVRATFSGDVAPGRDGWASVGGGASMAAGDVVTSKGSAAAEYVRLTGRGTPTLGCGSGCAVMNATIASAANSRTITFRYRDANASRGATKDLIWATGGGGFAQHAPSTRGTLRVDFRSGAATAGGSKVKRDVAHGTLMLVAWGALNPLAAGFARMKFLFPNGKWFLGHSVGMLLGGIVFGAACIHLVTANYDGHVQTDTFHSHQKLGIAVMFLWATQFLLGVFRPNKEPKDGNRFGFIPTAWRRSWYIAHAVLGPVTLVLATVTVVLGAVVIGNKWDGSADSGVKFLAGGGVYGLLTAVWVIIALGVWRDRIAKASSGVDNYGVGDSTLDESETNAR